jgi:hypothetical protein
MKKLSHVNWSEVVREAIIEKIRKEGLRREIDASKLNEAAKLTDSVRRKYPGWDSTEEIRVWREKRR